MTYLFGLLSRMSMENTLASSPAEKTTCGVSECTANLCDGPRCAANFFDVSCSRSSKRT